MKKKHSDKKGLIYIILGIAFIFLGVYMLIENKMNVGKHFYTQQHYVTGGGIIIVFGIISLVIGYAILPPWSKIRNFVERKNKRK